MASCKNGPYVGEIGQSPIILVSAINNGGKQQLNYVKHRDADQWHDFYKGHSEIELNRRKKPTYSVVRHHP